MPSLIFQQIYKTNRSRGGYALTELELPGVCGRRMSASSSVIASMIKNINACCSTFVQLFNEKYGRTSLFVMAIWMTSAFVFHGLTIYISEYSKAIEQNYYNQLTVNTSFDLLRRTISIRFSILQVTKFNFTYRNVNFQTSLDNMVFDRCTFQNCTFRRLYTNHVLFNNSVLENTEFASVKTSRTTFINSNLSEIKSVPLFCLTFWKFI